MFGFTLYTFVAGLAAVSLFVWLKYPYFMHDLKYAITVIGIGRRMAKFKKKPFYSILDRFLEQVKNKAQKCFILFEGRAYTYGDADRESNKVARALQEHTGLKEGDTVALLIGNEPHFVWLWLALCKLGCSAALLNYNIRSTSLLHCFSCSDAKVLVAGADLRGAVEEVLPVLKTDGVRVFVLGEDCGVDGIETLSDKVREASDEPLSPQLRANVTSHSPALYIYTSGTTGLPKAAVITHNRLWYASFIQCFAGIHSDDIIYIYLPLYHAAGFQMGFCGALDRGMTIVLRRKFSASQFWDDCRKYNVTVIQYIGEIIRYLCNTPKWGNPYALIRYDTENEEPVKDSKGFCIKVPKGETGLLVGKIGERTPFRGYVKNRQQTEKKILRDVFVKGDQYFNTGDLLSTDSEGFVYFQDRIGDTFRWKGENVATTEVADHLLTVDCVEEANVYGVNVPGHEGRIGMAALKLKDNMDFDCKATYQHVKSFLPSYARPRFIRIQNVLNVTGTFKQTKVKLVKDGFNPAAVKDPLFFLEDNKGYIPMTQDIYDSIAEGRLRL